MSGVCHAMLLVGIGAAAGAALVNLLCLLRMTLDAIVAGELEQAGVWPDDRSLTVWTGIDWFTVTVMPVAFGRWGVAACRDAAPRRAGPMELVGRESTEHNARARATELARHAMSFRQRETVLLVARSGSRD